MSEDKPKMINLLLADNVGISEVGVLDGNGPTGEGIRRVDSDGHSSGTDQRGDDVQESISGPTVKGEEGTEQTCEILMEKLNHDGGGMGSSRITDQSGLDRWVFAFRKY
jgi:hypothetical protein